MAQTTFPTPESWRSTLNLDALEQQHGLPAGLLTEVIRGESNGDPTAQNSGSGAAGLFQFMPDTAREYGIDPYDPQQAAPAAAKMLKSLYVKYDGDLDKTLAGYQWGQGRVDRLGLNQAPKATQSYIATITNALTPASADAASLDAFSARHFPQAGEPRPADVDAFSARHFPSSPAASTPAPPGAPSEALPTVRPNADPTQPATLEYPGTRPATRATDPALPPSAFTLNIEKASSQEAPSRFTGLNDVQLMQAFGYDPFLLTTAKGYRPGMLEAIVHNPGVQAGTLGGVVEGLKRPFLALTQGVTHALGSPADAALEDLKVKLNEAIYQETPHPTTDVPLLGKTDLPALTGTMLVPLPGTRGVVPVGTSAAGRIASGTANAALAGTVAGVAQPVNEPGTPGTANDTYWQQKLEQGQTGALVGGGTGALTSTVGAVGTKAVNAARNLSPRYAQVEEALTAATGKDGTVNERIFNAVLNSTPGAKFTGQEKWEVDGLQKLMQHIQSTSDKLTKAGEWLQTGAIILPGTLTRAGFTAVKLAKMLYSTRQGRNFLLAASDLQPGSGAMSRLVDRIGSELPRLMATDTTQPDAPAP